MRILLSSSGFLGRFEKRSPSVISIAVLVLVVLVGMVVLSGQRGGAFRASRDHPAIQYTDGAVENVVVDLNADLQSGAASLDFDEVSGYLASVLGFLEIPTESQLLVFSPTSLQADLIRFDNPRAVFFADDIALGWVRGAEVLELAVQDRQQGTVFYTLTQSEVERPQFERRDNCLACHLSWDTLGVPGLQVLSMFPMPKDKNAYASGHVTDHRSRLQDRWGGWYVTGDHGGVAHMGNVEVVDVDDPQATFGTIPDVRASMEGVFDLTGYPSPYSDIVALMVLEHQAHMANLITRLGWEARRVEHRESMTVPSDRGRSTDDGRFNEIIDEAAVELVDYLLFVDEAPIPSGVVGTSGFNSVFSERGPFDRRGRSLREFDLEERLFRYPCSYMIYTDSFDALPPRALETVFARLWAVLSGEVTEAPYDRLSYTERQAIVEILIDTKTNLPDYFVPLAVVVP